MVPANKLWRFGMALSLTGTLVTFAELSKAHAEEVIAGSVYDEAKVSLLQRSRLCV